MFSNKAVFNLLDFDDALIVVSADASDATIKVELLGSKSFANPERQQPVPPTLVGNETFTVGSFSSRNFDLDNNLPAFQGGYGAVRISTVDPNMFIGFATVRNVTATEEFVDRHPISGPTCGNAFRIPLLFNPGQRVRVAITSLDEDQIVAVGPTNHNNPPVTITADSTYLWDSHAVNLDVSQAGGIDVMARGTGRLAVSAVILRTDTPHKVRVYPLPLTRPT
jgi:hypothetical protein